MNTVFVYHWWDYPSDAPPISNLRSPILLSIATLRAVNSDVPIYVIDINEESNNRWGDYPKLLDFKIFKKKPFLSNYSHREGNKNLSRLFDIQRSQLRDICYVEGLNIVYVDSDVFFLRNPLPLEQNTNRFCFNKYNSGFFYYNREATEQFRSIFESYAITALNDDSFRYITKQFGECDDYFVLDETLLHYMYVKMPELFNAISINEHFTFGMAEYERPTNPKMIHANGLRVANAYAKHQYEAEHSRGLCCLLIKQLYQNICKVVDPKESFTSTELDSYLSKQVPFDDSLINKVLLTKQNGCFDLMNAV